LFAFTANCLIGAFIAVSSVFLKQASWLRYFIII
jgi:hypothetical protein